MALHPSLSQAPPRKGFGKVEKLEMNTNGKKRGSIRILITVTVIGSAGPIRFVVREEELVSAVIGTALKTYAREGRRPVLGCDLDDFVLYHTYDGSLALHPWEPIGSFGGRKFLLCKKQRLPSDERTAIPRRLGGKKCSGGWKARLYRSLALIFPQRAILCMEVRYK